MSFDASLRRQRVCVVTTHPIQYAAPWFQRLAVRGDIDLHVIYFRHLNTIAQGAGFGKAFTWDIPLLTGYSNQTLEIPVESAQMWPHCHRLWRSLADANPDVVLVTGWNEPMLIVAQVMARLLGCFLIVRGDSNDLRRRSIFLLAAHWLLHRIPNAFLTVGRANRRFYERLGVKPTRLFPCLHFVENERLAQMRDCHRGSRESLRLEYSFLPEDFVVLFCGKHVAFKRPGWVLEAVAILRKRGLHVKVLLAGSGELTGELKETAERLAVPTVFTGFLNQTELWRAYLAADAFVLPSDSGETWGLVTNEAMLFGLPSVVSSQVGCAEDLVIDEQTGYVFDGGPEALATQLEKLVRDRAVARAAGERARHHVETNYTMAAATAGLMQALRLAER